MQGWYDLNLCKNNLMKKSNKREFLVNPSIKQNRHQYRKVMGSNPIQAWIFFSACFFNCLSWEQLLRGSQISLMSIRSLNIWFSYIHIQVYSEWYLLWWDFWCDKTEVFAAVLVSLELICGRPRWPLHTFLLKMFNTCLPLKYFNNSWTEC